MREYNLTWKKIKAQSKTFIVFTDLSIPVSEMIKTANKQYFKKHPDELQCVSGFLDKNGKLTLSSRFIQGQQVVWCVCKKV